MYSVHCDVTAKFKRNASPIVLPGHTDVLGGSGGLVIFDLSLQLHNLNQRAQRVIQVQARKQQLLQDYTKQMVHMERVEALFQSSTG